MNGALAFALSSYTAANGTVTTGLSAIDPNNVSYAIGFAAIGLNTSIQAFIKAGPRALALGGATWLAVMLSSLAVQLFTRIW